MQIGMLRHSTQFNCRSRLRTIQAAKVSSHLQARTTTNLFVPLQKVSMSRPKSRFHHLMIQVIKRRELENG